MISPLAERIAIDRGKPRRTPRPTCIILHQTGVGLVERARRAGADPEEFAVAYYSQAEAYPHYLVAPDGSVWAFADEEERTAHAAWTPAERMIYRDWHGPRAGGGPTGPFRWWRRRWALTASSPVTLLLASCGTTPNLSGIGVEVLHHRPMSDAAYTSLARLCLDIGLRWAIDLGDGGPLPSPTLLGHADLSPLRRTARGRPYDPDLVLDWTELEVAIGRESSMTWRTWT